MGILDSILNRGSDETGKPVYGADPGLNRTTDQDKQLIIWAEQNYTRMKNERIPLDRQMYVNLAFYSGRQNIAVVRSAASVTGFAFITPKAPPWRVRMVINHIRRFIRSETARLAKQRPRPFVVPNTTEDEDLAAARVAEQILTAYFDQPTTLSIIRQWIWWGSVTGTSFLKLYYDKNEIDHTTNEKGKMCLSRLTPFEIFVPDLTVEDVQDQAYILHAHTKSAEDVERYYGVTVFPDTHATSDVMEDQFLNLVGAQQSKKNRVLLLEYWLKPGAHPQFPKGGMFTVGGGKLLQVTDGMPYRHNEFPFYRFITVPSGRFHGDSVIVDLIPVQREYNRTRSQLIESQNLMGKPKLIGHKGAVDPKMITSEPGQYIAVNGGYELPVPWIPPPIPQYILEGVQQLQADMEDIAGQHEVSQGQNPSQVTAATALSYLQEQDDVKLDHAVASIEAAVSTLGTHYLKMVTQFWTTPRLVKVVGRDGLFEVDHWKSSDLKGNTDVRVEAGSAMPTSKAAKQAFVMELFKIGAFPPERLLEMLDLHGAEKIYEETLVDKRHAQRENLKMASLTPQQVQMAGQIQVQAGMGSDTPMVRVNDYDNHELHIYFHNLFRKSQQYELLDPSVKQEFEKHVMMHRIALMEGTTPHTEVQQMVEDGEQQQIQSGQEDQQAYTEAVPPPPEQAAQTPNGQSGYQPQPV